MKVDLRRRLLSPIEGLLSGSRLQILYTMLSKGGVAGAGAVSAAIVAKAGGAQELGYFALIRVVPSVFVLLTELGISNSYPYLVRRLGHDSKLVYRSGILAFLLVALLQAVAWYALAPEIRDHFFPAFSTNQVLGVGLIAPAQVLLLHITNLQRSIGEIRSANLVFTSVEVLIVIALMGFTLDSDFNVSEIILSVVAASAIVTLGGLWSLSRRGYKFRPLLRWTILRESLSYGLRAQAGNAFQVLNYRLDQLIIGAMLGATHLGAYVVASKAAELFRFFSMSIVFVVEPMLAGRSIADATDVVRRNYSKVFAANLMMMTVGAAVVPIFVPMIFGGWSASALLPFFVISLGMVISGSNGLIGAYNFSIGAPGLNTKVIAAGFGAALLGNLFLVPRLGIVGAAWATVSTQVVVTFLFWRQFTRNAEHMKRSNG